MEKRGKNSPSLNGNCASKNGYNTLPKTDYGALVGFAPVYLRLQDIYHMPDLEIIDLLGTPLKMVIISASIYGINKVH